MWKIIAAALVRELEANPDRVLELLEQFIQLLKDHPEAIEPIIKAISKASETKEEK